MKAFLLLTLTLILGCSSSVAEARNVQAELRSVQQQKQLIKKAQQALNQELGEVGKNLKQLDVSLLEARKAYRQVRKEINTVDEQLIVLSKKKKTIEQSMQSLYEQMLGEAQTAYKHGRTQSVWVDMLSDISITELPHRQYLLKSAMMSQDKDRQAWQVKMEALTAVEKEVQSNKDKLLALKEERKQAESNLVAKIAAKKDAAKSLRSDIKKKKAQELRLAKQEKALKRLLDGLADTLLSSDKKSTSQSILNKKGKLIWPLDGSIVVGFKKKTPSGVTIAGVHIAPDKRSEQGKLVRAMGEGQVRYADWFGGYGLMMIVDYGRGIMAVYAHNDALHKQIGDWVEKDEVLAEAGSTGWVNDVRLYFEIRDKGTSVDPTRWCRK